MNMFLMYFLIYLCICLFPCIILEDLCHYQRSLPSLVKSQRSRNQFDVKLPLIETENTGNESLCERNNMPDR